MLEKIITFWDSLFNNLYVFYFGIIVAVIMHLIIKNLIINKMKNNLDFTSYKIIIKCILIPFILIFMLLAMILIDRSWNGLDITDANVLSAIVSFISPFIAFTGAYSLAEYNREQDRDNRKKEEELYSKEMLYSLLEHTVNETELIVKEIHIRFLTRRAEKQNLKPIKKAFKETLLLECECFIREMYSITSCDDMEFKESITKRLENLVYDKEWTKYMKFLESKDRDIIISWLNLFNSNQLSVERLILYREKIIKILKKDKNKNGNLKPLNQIIEESMYLSDNVNKFREYKVKS